MKARIIIEDIFRAGVQGVLPTRLIADSLSLEGDFLRIGQTTRDLGLYKRIFLLGFGKASAAMAAAVEKILGNRLTHGFIITKYGHTMSGSAIPVAEAGHPVPDLNGVAGAGKIIELAREAGDSDLVIVLVSGGGSALLADLPEDISLEELAVTNQLLVNSGASISEINCIRKHISLLKGGQLARMVQPAELIVLAVSDVAGDPPDVIASGPVSADPTTFGEALQIIDRYQLRQKLPGSVVKYLERGYAGLVGETVKPGDPCLEKTTYIILGNNALALQKAAHRAEELGFEPNLFGNPLTGKVEEAANYIFSEICRRPIENGKKTALVFGGEPLVTPTGNGKGGRNQHLALLMAEKIAGMPGITFLAGGTDGTDGPTDAAGAICDSHTLGEAARLGLDAGRMIREFDSYHFFQAAGGMLLTGPTGTNVMDIMIVLIGR